LLLLTYLLPVLGSITFFILLFLVFLYEDILSPTNYMWTLEAALSQWNWHKILLEGLCECWLCLYV
jgi:hypothetical protein